MFPPDSIPGRRAVLLGIGRRGDGDDALGPVFARAFRHPRWIAVDASTSPENFGPLLRRAAPPLVAVLDAVRMGLPPGSVRVLDPASLDASGFGTHAPDPALLDAFLRLFAPRTLWLGIQPASLRPGTRLSPPVKAALHSLPDALPADF